MACGLPVIVGDETAPREFVDAESGLLVPAKDVGAIAMAMEYLIGHRAEYDMDKIRNKIVTRFGLMEFGKCLQNVYMRLI
jgi:glycosyltransferase involved in cell wall biosynthesis